MAVDASQYRKEEKVDHSLRPVEYRLRKTDPDTLLKNSRLAKHLLNVVVEWLYFIQIVFQWRPELLANNVGTSARTMLSEEARNISDRSGRTEDEHTQPVVKPFSQSFRSLCEKPH